MTLTIHHYIALGRKLQTTEALSPQLLIAEGLAKLAAEVGRVKIDHDGLKWAVLCGPIAAYGDSFLEAVYNAVDQHSPIKQLAPIPQPPAPGP